MAKHRDDRSDFLSDEEFANFRKLILNNRLSANFYRSASCRSNMYGRAEIVTSIMAQYGIQYVLDLTTLRYECMSEDFAKALVFKLEKLVTKDGPYIVQCDAGKKRTGFTCMILEALSGTSYINIVNDYLISYRNNNDANFLEDSKSCSQVIEMTINPRLRYITDSVRPLSEIDLCASAKKFLIRNGLSHSTLLKLQEVLLK